MDGVIIRQEAEKDFEAVFQVVKIAFEKQDFSDRTEQYLVQNLRKSPSFVSELSLVADYKNQIIGHILFTKIIIKDGSIEHPSLSLAPLSVLPKFQKMGIGSALILKAHEIAIQLGYSSAIVLGHEAYYPKFGYKRASDFGIELPFGAADENNMAIELVKGGLSVVKGQAIFDEAFYF